MSDVFLSYSQKSQKHAEALASQLQALGISTWLDSKNLAAGTSWESAIQEAVKDARVIAFLLESSSATDSDKMQKESMVALEHSWADKDKILVPILLGNAEPPPFLRQVRGIRVRQRNPEWQHTAKEIAELLRRGSASRHSKATVKEHLKRSIKEQLQRLELIERGANELRGEDTESARK